MTSPEDHIARRARELFQRASHELDPTIAGRLRAARREALQRPAPTPLANRLLLPAGAFAMLALATLLVWQPHQRAPESALPSSTTAATSIDIESELPPDADSADPNLYQNLDFYGWLADNQKTTKEIR